MELRRSITVGISGSSGSVYAVRLLELLPRFYAQIDVVMSSASRQVMAQETDAQAPLSGPWQLGEPAREELPSGQITVWNDQDYNAPFASGSNCAGQMIVIPCSMSTVASIAHGIDQNLLHHAAGVTLKEKKQLLIVPRETPLSAVHLRNLTTLAELGVAVIPAMPGFYGGQKTFDDLINFVLQKVVNQLGVDLRLSKPWASLGERGEVKL